MPLSSFRKKLNLGFGLILLGIVGIALWPLLSRPLELRRFCSELRPGVSLASIRIAVANNGFKVSPEVNGGAYVYDLQSLGKFNCTLSLQGGIMINASFVVVD